MKHKLLIILLIILNGNAFSQINNEFYTYSTRCKPTYSFEAYENKIEGRVLLSFMVDSNRRLLINSVEVIKGLGYGLNEIAIQNFKNKKYHKYESYTNSESKIDSTNRFTLVVSFKRETLSNNNCEMSDYIMYKGDKASLNNDVDRAIELYSSALRWDKTNLEAQKKKCLLIFKFKEDKKSAKKAWKKLYLKLFISQKEYDQYIN